MDQLLLSASDSSDQTLYKLNRMRKKLRGPADHAQVQHQRKQSTTPDASLQQAWFRSMRNVLEEIDESLKCIGSWSFRFLDLGCCPGGFSSYILGKNPYASGVGISLEVENGGHAFMLEEEMQSRFELIWGDVNHYQLGPFSVNDPALKPLPVISPGYAPFDLVLIDGHPLRAQGKHDDVRFFMKADQLLISQLIIGLSTISLSGGTIIMKLSKPERVVTAQLMYLFDIMSLSVQTWKPVCMHATQDTFYLVAKGFGLGAEGHKLPHTMLQLMALWLELMYGSLGRGRRLQDGDLNFIVDAQVLKHQYAARHRSLSQHIWMVQAQSIQGLKQARASGF
ncbi:hypothetical protein BDZ94DRAFT_1196646 [Collybia nuda]|uniref:Ribosomal RNA methyltransferase FtsJ domain-containing protein n=1 Tax=Collybia nuda TaxID=64659 RepID=A0A9P5Y2J8_9AGAR|nr:hypothetical protein BDZ94DRAFT_1196646 [Collybia nuda]